MNKFQLFLDQNTLNTIGLALSELPYKVACPIMNDLQSQVDKQMQEKAEKEKRELELINESERINEVLSHHYDEFDYPSRIEK